MDCKHENMQTIMSNAWIDGEKLYSIRCLDCGAMTEFYFTVGEARKRFKLGMFWYVEGGEDDLHKLRRVHGRQEESYLEAGDS